MGLKWATWATHMPFGILFYFTFLFQPILSLFGFCFLFFFGGGFSDFFSPS
jgi:hypothetical protein